LNTDNDARRKRLLFRSWHRGTRELDLLLGGFAERYLSTATQLEVYEQLLEFSDPDIYLWITEAEPVPKVNQSDILTLLQNFKTTV
jgi:antitoxin CptB